jgi:hypothetical protein
VERKDDGMNYKEEEPTQGDTLPSYPISSKRINMGLLFGQYLSYADENKTQ